MKELIEKYADKVKLYFGYNNFYIKYNSKIRNCVIGIDIRGNDAPISKDAFETTQQEFMYLKVNIISALFTSYHIEYDFLDYGKYEELLGVKFEPNKSGYYDQRDDNWIEDSDKDYDRLNYQWSDKLNKTIPYPKSLPYFKDWIQSKEFIDEYGESFLQTILTL